MGGPRCRISPPRCPPGTASAGAAGERGSKIRCKTHVPSCPVLSVARNELAFDTTGRPPHRRARPGDRLRHAWRVRARRAARRRARPRESRRRGSCLAYTQGRRPAVRLGGSRAGPSQLAPPRRRATLEGGPVNTGGDLLSRTLARQVPSALRGLTALFGMGRGVSPSLSPPKIGGTPGPREALKT